MGTGEAAAPPVKADGDSSRGDKAAVGAICGDLLSAAVREAAAPEGRSDAWAATVTTSPGRFGLQGWLLHRAPHLMVVLTPHRASRTQVQQPNEVALGKEPADASLIGGTAFQYGGLKTL